MTDLTTASGVARLALGECDVEIQGYIDEKLGQVFDENLKVAALDEIKDLAKMLEAARACDRVIALASENAVSEYLMRLSGGLAPEVVTLVRRRLAAAIARLAESTWVKKAGEQLAVAMPREKVVIQ